MNVAQLEDQQSPAEPPRKVQRYTGEILLRTRPKTYRKVISLLAEPNASVNQITQICKVSEHTVNAIKERHETAIAERKNELVHILTDLSHISTNRALDTVGKASCRDAAVVAGISIDKTLALLGQSPVGVQVAVANLPTESDREERRQLHDKLDAIAARLNAP